MGSVDTHATDDIFRLDDLCAWLEAKRGICLFGTVSVPIGIISGRFCVGQNYFSLGFEIVNLVNSDHLFDWWFS